MIFNCLRCNALLTNDFQLIFDETGIELQLDKLLSEHFDISVIEDSSTTQAVCNECVNTLIELYDTQKYKEETLVFSENDEYEENTEIEEIFMDIEDKNETHNDIIVPEMEEKLSVNTEDFKEIIEESTSVDDEMFLGFSETEEELNSECNVLSNEVNIQDYLDIVIKSDLTKITFDQNSVCKFCDDKTILSHEELLTHILESHETDSKQYPCIFCEDLKFDSVNNLAFHIISKHYDLNTITIYCTCPECDKRFSSFLEYNKHSCYSKSFGDRLQQKCDKCEVDFISNKRFRFHQQFHLNKQRPKVCFICRTIFNDENEFFEHIMYAHEKDDSLICKLCDRIFTAQKLFENHMQLHKAHRPYHCSFCSKSYFYNQMLIAHVQKYHSNENPNECKLCKKSLANKHLLTRHMQLIHMEETEGEVFVCSCDLIAADEEDPMTHPDDQCSKGEYNIECLKIAYACEFCELAYKSIEKLKEHRDIFHSDGIYKCWICQAAYQEYKKLKTHILTHNDIEQIQKSFPINRHYVCNFESCEQSYSTWPSLRAHAKRHTTKFSCNICNQTFNNEAKLQRHFKSHDNNGEYPCQFCPKMCTNQMSLSVHIARKHNNNYKTCSICKSCLASEEALEEHIEAVHTEATCELCGKVTKNKRNLLIHIQMIHSQIKRFFCSVCNKGYFNNSDLKFHEKAVHEEPNKFQCEFCQFSSSYETSFKAHILKHQKNKPFKCEECSREFTRKACYKLHVLRHSDNKPYACPVELCGRSFVMPGILNSHIKIAHPECIDVQKIKKSNQQNPPKRKKPNPKTQKCVAPESETSLDFITLQEDNSNLDYLKVEDEDGNIVIFEESKVDEEIVVECSDATDDNYILN